MNSANAPIAPERPEPGFPRHSNTRPGTLRHSSRDTDALASGPRSLGRRREENVLVRAISRSRGPFSADTWISGPTPLACYIPSYLVRNLFSIVTHRIIRLADSPMDSNNNVLIFTRSYCNGRVRKKRWTVVKMLSESGSAVSRCVVNLIYYILHCFQI